MVLKFDFSSLPLSFSRQNNGATYIVIWKRHLVLFLKNAITKQNVVKQNKIKQKMKENNHIKNCTEIPWLIFPEFQFMAKGIYFALEDTQSSQIIVLKLASQFHLHEIIVMF